jgi:hypothetical protein
MKRIYSLFTCFIILALVAGTTSVNAQTQASSSARVAQTASAPNAPFSRFFLQDPLTSSAYWHSHTIVDSSGGVHLTFYDTSYIYYAYCANDCGDTAKWFVLPLFEAGEADSLDEPTLGIDPSGNPRLFFYAEYGGDEHYFYAECNSNCINNSSNWTSVAVADLNGYGYPQNVRYGALDTLGRPRLVYSISGYPDSGFYYLACDVNCTTASNWSTTTVDTPDLLPDILQLVFDSSNRPRVLGYDENNSVFMYAECDSECTMAANWGSVGLFSEIYYMSEFGFALRVTAQGNPRIAFYDGHTDNNVLNYAWSNDSHLSPSGWHSYTKSYPTNDLYWSLDLALDNQERPVVALATYDLDMSYVSCSTNCETNNSTWQQQIVETTDDLEAEVPIPVATDCESATWSVSGLPSLALDAANNPSMSYRVLHVQLCYDIYGHLQIYPDAQSIRFATTGGTVTPVAPTSVTINGPTLGVINVSYTFTATVSPNTATTPITYVWEATGQTTQTHTGGGISDTASFTWPASGTGNKTITVTASNSAGSALQSSHILITTEPIIFNNPIYLPLVVR